MAKIKDSKLTPSFELLKPSTNIIRDNLLIYFVLAVLPSLILGFQFARFGTNASIILSSGIIIISIISLLLYPPLIYTYLHTAKGKKVELSESIIESYKHFWPLIGVTILSGMIILLGLLLFIVPGIIMLRRYMLAPFYVMDRNLGITEAMTTSAAESKQYSGPVYGILGVNLVFAIIGVVPVLGQIIASILQILYSVAPAIRYLEIKEAVKH